MYICWRTSIYTPLTCVIYSWDGQIFLQLVKQPSRGRRTRAKPHGAVLDRKTGHPKVRKWFHEHWNVSKISSLGRTEPESSTQRPRLHSHNPKQPLFGGPMVPSTKTPKTGNEKMLPKAPRSIAPAGGPDIAARSMVAPHTKHISVACIFGASP